MRLGDGNLRAVDGQVVAARAGDVAQVDHERAVAHDELLGVELLGDVRKPPAHVVDALGRVVDEVVVKDLHIHDVVGGEADDAVRRLEGEHGAGGVFQPGDGLVQHIVDGELVRGLDDEVQRVHLVALDGELGHVRHENQHGIGVDFAHDARDLQPVELVHADVHEHDVEVLRAADEVQRRIEHAEHVGFFLLPEILCDECAQRGGVIRVVVHNSQQQHDAFTPLRVKIRLREVI